MLDRKIRFEDYEVDFACCELRKCGVRIGLQRKPFRVLELLLSRPGALVTREELFSFLWPDSHVGFEHGLNTAVNSLRQVLGDSSRDCRFIETRPGIGYRFTATVEEVHNGRSRSVKGSGAYEDCLKGWYFLDRMCEEDVYKALAFFNSAIEDEHCSSLAHAGIADAYCQLALLGSAHSSKLAQPARSAAHIAVRNAPDEAHAQVASGRVKMTFDWDWKGAAEAASRAAELDPNSATAQGFQASLLFVRQQYEEARQACGKALALEPLSFPATLQLAACLYAEGDFKAATDQCWKMLTLAPCFAPAQILLASAYERLEMYEEALVEFQNAQLVSGFEASSVGGIGHVFAVTDRRAEAEECLLQLTRHSLNRHVSPYWFAVVCAGLEQEDRTFSYLEECLAQRDPALLGLTCDCRFGGLLHHQRFQSVLTTMRLP